MTDDVHFKKGQIKINRIMKRIYSSLAEVKRDEYFV